MGTCSVRVTTKNSQGKRVESKLYKALEKYTGSKEEADKIYFRTATNPTWLETIGNYEKDENGEITLKSLLRHSGLNIESDKIIQKLNQELGVGEYNFEEASEKVKSFNATSDFNDTHIATLEYTKDGKYKVHVVERTAENENKMRTTLRHFYGFNEVMNKLRKLGINVDFIDPDQIYGNGEYNTEYYETLENGTINLIKVAEGDTDTMDRALTEETGHFIVAGLRGTSIYERFRSWLENDVHRESVKSIVTDASGQNKLGLDDTDELMGDLIGKRIYDGNIPHNVVSRFISKMITKLQMLVLGVQKNAVNFRGKKLNDESLNKINSYQVKQDLLRAKLYAEQMASKFLNGKFSQEQIDNALSHPEIKFDADLPTEIMAYRDQVRVIKDFISNSVKLYGSNKADAMLIGKDLLNFVTANRQGLFDDRNTTLFHMNSAVQGITLALEAICAIIPQFFTTLNSMDFTSIEGVNANLLDNCNKLVTCRNFTQMCLQSLDAVDTLIKSARRGSGIQLEAVEVIDSFGSRSTINLIGLAQDMRNKVLSVEGTIPIEGNLEGNRLNDGTMLGMLKTAEIEIAEQIIFQQTGLREIPKSNLKGFRGKTDHVGGISIKNALLYIYDDASWFDAHIKSMSMCKDIPSQIVDYIVRRQKNLSNKATNTALNNNRQLREKMLKDGIKDTIIFFEENKQKSTTIYRNGKTYQLPSTNRFSGNLIQEYDFGSWEQKRHEVYTNARNKFWEEYRQNNPDASDNQIAVAFNIYAHEVMKKFHEEHSQINENYGTEHKTGNMKYLPNKSYINEDYFKDICEDENKIAEFLNISQEEAKKYADKNKKQHREFYLNQFLKLKAEADFELEDEAPPYYRAPQFKGVFGRRVKAIKGKTKHIKALRDEIKDQYCLSSEDRDFGGMSDYETVEDDPANNSLMFEYSRPSRLPMYGVHKLRNMNELNTDLFTSMLCYQSMAFDYKGLKATSGALEVIAQTVADRRVVKNNRERTILRENSKGTRVHSRLIKYLEKNIYSNSYFGPGSGYYTKRYKKKLKNGEEHVYERRIMYAKIANIFSNLARRLYLGGNLHGAIINDFTGFIEMYKESFAGQYFNQKEYMWAIGKYFGEILFGMKGSAEWHQAFKTTLNKDDFLSLLIRQFDVLGSANENFRNWNTTRNRVTRAVVEDSLMLPYKTGDHFMQVVPFLSMMKHTKVYQKQPDGSLKKISLIDAYKVVKRKETSQGNKETTTKELQLLPNVYKTDDAEVVNKTERLIELQKEIKKHLDYIAEHPDEEIPLDEGVHIDEYLDILEDDNYWVKRDKRGNIVEDSSGNPVVVQRNYESIKDLEILQSTISDKINEVMWNEYDESNFTDKCRIITNSMHGVYNKIDKAQLTQNIYFNMLATMKGYAFGMAQRRFNSSSYSVVLDQDMEGSIVTALKVFSNVWKTDRNTGKKQGFWNTAGLILTPELMHKKAIELGYSETQYRNMKRNKMDYLIMFTLTALANFVFAKPKKRDDEDQEEYQRRLSHTKALGYYITMRLASEQAAFNWIDMTYEFKQLLDVMPAAGSATWDIGETAYRLGYGGLTGDDKMLQKAYNKMYGMCPYLKTKKVWDDPYKATDSYFFTRTAKR